MNLKGVSWNQLKSVRALRPLPPICIDGLDGEIAGQNRSDRRLAGMQRGRIVSLFDDISMTRPSQSSFPGPFEAGKA